jgi:hypothetical protein
LRQFFKLGVSSRIGKGSKEETPTVRQREVASEPTYPPPAELRTKKRKKG